MGYAAFPENIPTIAVGSTTTVTFAATNQGTSTYVTVGGQQYSPTSALSLSTATPGAAGLDTGTIAAASAYNVYVIVQASSFLPALIASLAGPSTGPTIPSGYLTAYKLVGSFITNATSQVVAAQGASAGVPGTLAAAGSSAVFGQMVINQYVAVSGLTNSPLYVNFAGQAGSGSAAAYFVGTGDTGNGVLTLLRQNVGSGHNSVFIVETYGNSGSSLMQCYNNADTSGVKVFDLSTAGNLAVGGSVSASQATANAAGFGGSIGFPASTATSTGIQAYAGSGGGTSLVFVSYNSGAGQSVASAVYMIMSYQSNASTWAQSASTVVTIAQSNGTGGTPNWTFSVNGGGFITITGSAAGNHKMQVFSNL